MPRYLRVVMDCSELGGLLDDVLSEVGFLCLPPVFLYHHAIDAICQSNWHDNVVLDGKLSIYSPTGELLINAIEYIATCIRTRLERMVPVVAVDQISLLSVYGDTLYLQLTLPGETYHARAIHS